MFSPGCCSDLDLETSALRQGKLSQVMTCAEFLEISNVVVSSSNSAILAGNGNTIENGAG